mmetsp:Transcript_128124/g.362716  ORF Transcript_128124/g.362716 Transcript_128124/m.362716 type:complete len:190 (-) Transcript_128124:8-577(-)
MGSTRNSFKKYDGSFLLSANLSTPRTKAGGRRKRGADPMDSRELPAESRPRTQQKWIEEERRQTKLPTSARDKECAPTYSATEPTDGAVGKKKQKRMKVVLKKEAQKAQKKVKVQAQEVAEAAQSLKGKAGAKELAPAAREVLKRGRKGPESEQQVLATTAERITANPEKDIELFDVFFELHLAGSDAR